jgi:hypothetical protein
MISSGSLSKAAFRVENEPIADFLKFSERSEADMVDISRRSNVNIQVELREKRGDQYSRDRARSSKKVQMFLQTEASPEVHVSSLCWHEMKFETQALVPRIQLACRPLGSGRPLELDLI